MTDAPLCLVADVGGTNTRVALARAGRIVPGTVRRYSNSGFAGLDAVLAQFRADEGCAVPDGACVAVAGPVRGGVGRLTNLDWAMDGAGLAAATGARTVAVLNDLQAQGHALGHLAPGAHRSIIAAAAEPGGSQLVIGVGTGFNAAPVHEGPGGRVVVPSECGHVTLPVRSEADLRLSRFVAQEHGFPGVEEVLSGRGIAHVDAWAAGEAGETGTRDSAGVLAALEAGEERARQTVATAVRMLGAVAGDLALIHLPFGGVHLIGGMARALVPWLGEFGFAEAFRDKGRFAPLMADFPVSVIEDDFAALTGCAHYLARRMGAGGAQEN